MIYLIIPLAILAIFSMARIFKVASGHFYNSETSGEVVGHTRHYDDSDYPNQVTGYSPVIRFVVNGKEYQGAPEVAQKWPSPGRYQHVTVLYNPQDPSKFIFKEDGTGQMGCLYLFVAIISIIAIIWIAVTTRWD